MNQQKFNQLKHGWAFSVCGALVTIVKNIEQEMEADPLNEAQQAEFNRMKAQTKTPYPGFCRTPEKCAGRSCCPGDPTCID